jgi:hypothetical protein
MSEAGSATDSAEARKEWQWLNQYCITDGSYNITLSGKGKSERFTVWNVQVEPAKMESIHYTMEEARRAAGNP